MRQLSLLLCSAMLTTSAFGQHLSPCFVFGINLSDLYGKNNYGMKMKAGVQGGLSLPVQIRHRFVLEPEVLFSNLGAKYTTSNGAKHSLSLNYICIPVQANYLINQRFSVQTGPQISFLIDVQDEVAGNETGFFTSQDFKTVDFLWSTGIKYRWNSNLGINGRYSFSIDEINNGGLNKFKNQVLQLGFFYALKIHRKMK